MISTNTMIPMDLGSGKQSNLQAQLLAEDEEAAYWNHIINMQNDIDQNNDSDGPWFWESK